jgi:hypothetical protein
VAAASGGNGSSGIETEESVMAAAKNGGRKSKISAIIHLKWRKVSIMAAGSEM